MEQKNFGEKIAELLKEKNALKCPVCGEENPAVVDGIFAHAIQGNTALPCALVICKNCGFTREHAVDPLGIKIMPNNAKANNN